MTTGLGVYDVGGRSSDGARPLTPILGLAIGGLLAPYLLLEYSGFSLIVVMCVASSLSTML